MLWHAISNHVSATSRGLQTFRGREGETCVRKDGASHAPHKLWVSNVPFSLGVALGQQKLEPHARPLPLLTRTLQPTAKYRGPARVSGTTWELQLERISDFGLEPFPLLNMVLVVFTGNGMVK